ncbi:MAG: carbohydrate kinase [Oscillospiraceae bacterium]|nr:carbohydrate kinase [Oscillospiraceae bacterium]
MTDVVALGELLIDFTENGLSGQGNPLFEANPGGAPCNVLAILRKLGKSCTFIGKVGNDMFGKMLEQTAQNAGIDTRYLLKDNHIPTTLAFVKTLAGGDRDFSFYRKPGADMCLTAEELPEQVLQNARIFHFGSVSQTHEPVRSATKAAVEIAKEAGALISYDPNLRPPLWDDLEEARKEIAWGLGKCDILKIADNELLFMTGEEDFDKGAALLKEQYPNLKLINVTAGAGGSYAYYGGKRVFVPAFCLGGTIETTGAGDTFCGSVLSYILEKGLVNLTEENLTQMLRFANAAAYLVTTKKGAILSMPERKDVEKILFPG